jgi:hypothetical protein
MSETSVVTCRATKCHDLVLFQDSFFLQGTATKCAHEFTFKAFKTQSIWDDRVVGITFSFLINIFDQIFINGRQLWVWVCTEASIKKKKETPWPGSTSELYRPSDRRFSAKLVQAFAESDANCHAIFRKSLETFFRKVACMKCDVPFPLAQLHFV